MYINNREYDGHMQRIQMTIYDCYQFKTQPSISENVRINVTSVQAHLSKRYLGRPSFNRIY